MNKITTITLFAFAFLLAMSSFAIAAERDINFTEPSQNQVIEESNVDYEVMIEFPAEDISEYDISLFNSNDEFLGGSIGFERNHTGGTFIIEQDGDYYIKATFTLGDGTMVIDTVSFSVDFSINNPEIKILGYKNPTPFNNGLINSHNIDTAKIIAVSNKEAETFTVNIWNDTNNWSFEEPNTFETDFDFIKYWNIDLYDGVYYFNTNASISNLVISDVSATRTITIKATVPNATYDNYTYPSSVNEDTSFSIEFENFQVSESNLTVYVRVNGVGENIGDQELDEMQYDELSLTGSISDPGVYDLALVIADNYGNSESYELGNITVNDVPDANPTQDENNGGGGGGSNDEETEPVLVKSWNLVKVEEEVQEENDTETTEEETEKGNAVSFITGAVTGAFSTPPRAILTFIIIVVIIYAIVKIRGYMVADDKAASKKNANGKKTKKLKEEAEEVDSE
jgi:hypothetical protein